MMQGVQLFYSFFFVFYREGFHKYYSYIAVFLSFIIATLKFSAIIGMHCPSMLFVHFFKRKKKKFDYLQSLICSLDFCFGVQCFYNNLQNLINKIELVFGLRLEKDPDKLEV